jgi:fatty-acid peroxygenase
MASIPKDPTFDSSLAVMRDGFRFIQNRCQRYQSDIFETRLMFQKTICIHGEEAAALFYDPELFKRKGAIPKRVQKTLLGQKGVQTLDDAAHRHRKELFMSVMTRESIQDLMQLMAHHWQLYTAKWENIHSLILFDEVQDLLCRSACAWVGVPLREEEVRNRAYDFTAMVDAFGAVGPRHWRGRLARQRGNTWIKGLVEQMRRGELNPADTSIAHRIAWHRNLDGNLLDAKVAAVEIINLIRPIVAIAYYVAFAAHAMEHHPEVMHELQHGDPQYREWFVQEVRRFYPFAPFLGARVRNEFDWRGYHFKKNTLVLLDVYGTHRDPRIWTDGEAFRPERFRDWNGSPFNFIPQGGGDFLSGHRCAGEWVTIEALKLAVEVLTTRIRYQVPEQNMSFSLARLPTKPKSGIVIRKVSRMPADNSAPARPRVTTG